MKAAKLILTSFLFTFLAIGFVSQVQAQGQKRERPQGREQGQRPQMDMKKVAEEQINWFKENFKLTDDQAKLIEEIHTADASKRKEIVESGLTPRDDKFREQMDAANIFKEAELQEVLTKEQWVTFEEKKEEYGAIGRPQRPRRNG